MTIPKLKNNPWTHHTRQAPESVLLSEVCLDDGSINLVDTHVHTNYSDGTASVREVEEMCRRQDIGACITDHNEIRGSIKLYDRQKIPCLPGIELGSKEQVELIGFFNNAQNLEFFYKKQVEPNKMRKLYAFLPCPLETILRSVTEYGGVVSIPHPFGPLWKNVSHGKRRRPAVMRTIWQADCIEVWNGGLSKKANTKALKLCEQMGMIPLAGSDSHDPDTIGSVLVAFKESVTSDNMFHAILESRISAILARNGRPRYLTNAWKIAKRHSVKFIFN